MASPLVAFIYNTPAGLTDAQAFNDVLYATAGIYAEYVPLGQVELIDFSPYQAILVGDDTGDPASNAWYGTAAAVQKIRQSGKPVLGIGAGGSNLFDALGLFLVYGHSDENNQIGVATYSTQNTAWTTPAAVTVNPTINLYNSPVNYRAIDSTLSDYPWQAMTKIAAEAGPTTYFPILAQSAYNTCYTLWGFRSQPSHLTEDGKKLFSNLAWQPACRPAVLYLGGDDFPLKNDIGALLANSGFPYTLEDASDAANLSYGGYNVILLGWDVPDSTWNNLYNLLAVMNSRLPLIGMGGSGAYLLQRIGVPAANPYGAPVALQKEADLSDPLQLALRRPYPVAVSSTLRNYFDYNAGGVNIWGFAHDTIPPSEKVIGYWVTNHGFQVFASQLYKGVCYQLYGFKSYPGYMTEQAMGLLRNMLSAPACIHPVYLPVIKR